MKHLGSAEATGYRTRRRQENHQGSFTDNRQLERGLPENSPKPKNFTIDSHLRVEGRKTQTCKELSLVGLCNSLFTNDNYSRLPKFPQVMKVFLSP